MPVVSICSLKGGVGKTSVVLGLASAAYHCGLKTLVLDLDPQSSISLGMNTPEPTKGQVTVAELLGTGKKINLPAVLEVSPWISLYPPTDFSDADLRLDVLPGSAALAALEAPAGTAKAISRMTTRLSAALQEVEQDYDLVLIDCPPALGALTTTALNVSDKALIVTDPSLFAVTATDQIMSLIKALKKDGSSKVKPTGILVNKFRQGLEEHDYRHAELMAMFGKQVYAQVIPDKVAVIQAQGTSQPIHAIPGSPATEIAKVFDGLLVSLGVRASHPSRLAASQPMTRLRRSHSGKASSAS